MPGAPRHLQAVEVTRKAIVLEWEAPESDGGAAIRGYVVERRQDCSPRFLRVSKGLVLNAYFRDTAVYDDTSYEYRVAAQNEAGLGEHCAPIGPVAAKDPFGTTHSPAARILCLRRSERRKFYTNIVFFIVHYDKSKKI